MRSFGRRLGCTLMLLVVTGVMTAHAAAPASPQPDAAPRSDKAAHAGDAIAGFGVGVDAATLAGLRGGSDVMQSITLNGSVSNTSTEYVSTGLNSIGGGAFGNAAGLPMVIQNSGNSVLIQNATIVNLKLQP